MVGVKGTSLGHTVVIGLVISGLVAITTVFWIHFLLFEGDCVVRGGIVGVSNRVVRNVACIVTVFPCKHRGLDFSGPHLNLGWLEGDHVVVEVGSRDGRL